MNPTNLIELCRDKALRNLPLTRDEAIALTLEPDKAALYAAANSIREHYSGRKLDLCTIMNARSGRCKEDCAWCAQSARHKTQIDTYAMIDPQDAIRQARANEKAGAAKFSFVTSGRALPEAPLKALCRVYRKIGRETGLTLCASMGLLNASQLGMLARAGVKNYHCNLETAPSYFGGLCTTHTPEEKMATLQAAREAGMQLCSGGIIGMGESMEHRVELAMTLRALEVSSIPINLLHPVPGTRLEGMPPLSDEEILTTIAMFRFVCPQAWIRFAGGRILMKHLEQQALNAGINAALIGDLLTTVGCNMDEDVTHFRQWGYEC
jgi:biotin synthase